eukprot:8244454-Pyramimonas_sp.AAC.1
MEEMQRNHVEAEQQLEVARKATREADTAKSAFDVVAYKTAKVEEQRRLREQRQAQAQAAAGAVRPGPAPGGDGAPPPAGADGGQG